MKVCEAVDLAKAEELLAAFGPIDGGAPAEATASSGGLAAGLAALRQALHEARGGKDDAAEAATAAKAALAAAAAAK